MAGAIALRTDYTADALRRLALGTRDANVARRLLSLAAVREGGGIEKLFVDMAWRVISGFWRFD